MPIYIPAI